MGISKVLLNHVSDGDLFKKLEHVEFSTNLREIVTIGYMVDQYQASLKGASSNESSWKSA